MNVDARLKPHTIANPDRVKLKFYSNVLGDNSTFIHYVSLVVVTVAPVLCIEAHVVYEVCT